MALASLLSLSPLQIVKVTDFFIGLGETVSAKLTPSSLVHAEKSTGWFGIFHCFLAVFLTNDGLFSFSTTNVDPLSYKLLLHTDSPQKWSILTSGSTSVSLFSKLHTDPYEKLMKFEIKYANYVHW